MTSRPNIEMMVWGGHAEFIEEHLIHAVIVVLSGMNQYFLNLALIPERPRNYGRFHELRTGADNRDNSCQRLSQTSRSSAADSSKRRQVSSTESAI
jgi:hypothetical protein